MNPLPILVHHMAALDGWPHPPNTLEMIEASLNAGAVIIEIDITALANDDYLLVHDPLLERETDGQGEVGACSAQAARALHFRVNGAVTAYRVPLLSDVVALLMRHPHPAQLQLDFKNAMPFANDEPLRRLINLITPLGQRAIVSSGADWQLRQLRRLAPSLRLGFDIMWVIDWSANPSKRHPEELPHTLGAYGYLDDHVLAQRKIWATVDYLHDRCSALLGLVPNAEVFYVRHTFIAKCLDDGFDLADFLHAHDIKLDAWTLDVGNPIAEKNALRLRDAKVDFITTNTPLAMATLLQI